MKKAILATLTLSILIVGIFAVLPVQTRPQPASAADTDCPANTSEGAYFVRGHDKDGNVICGFAYYNECPYAAGYSADDPMCDKLKPTEEQLKPYKPKPETVNQCGGK